MLASDRVSTPNTRLATEERSARLNKDYDFVKKHTTSTWLKVSVQDMRRVRTAELTSARLTTAPTTALSSWHRGSRPGDVLPRLSTEQVGPPPWCSRAPCVHSIFVDNLK